MTISGRVSGWLRSISGRLFISHILVGVFTPLLIALLIALLVLTIGISFSPSDYAAFAEDVAILWLMPDSETAGIIRDSQTTDFTPPGYALVVARDDTVVFTYGDAPCIVGADLARCAPHFVDLAPGAMETELQGENWVDILLPISSGERVLARFASPTVENVGAWLSTAARELTLSVLVVTTIVAVVSIPIGAILVTVFARPLLRRIGRIASASQRFADGDLTARVLDRHHDEVSVLARQFDTMADVLQSNIFTLRELLKSNAELWGQVEQSAVQAERLRLARDLHDELAQQLFSLTMNSAALPDIIAQDSIVGRNQARYVADLAEKTLVGLRALLVDLRPGGLLDMGLAQALKVLCADWEQQHRIQTEVSVLLTHERFPGSLQTAVIQIARESLANIAKHAQATQVTVALVEGRQQIVLSISDNGHGLSQTDQRKDRHYGLLTMRERAEALGGALYIESESGRGTTIRAVLPLAEVESLT